MEALLPNLRLPLTIALLLLAATIAVVLVPI